MLASLPPFLMDRVQQGGKREGAVKARQCFSLAMCVSSRDRELNIPIHDSNIWLLVLFEFVSIIIDNRFISINNLDLLYDDTII